MKVYAFYNEWAEGVSCGVVSMQKLYIGGPPVSQTGRLELYMKVVRQMLREGVIEGVNIACKDAVIGSFSIMAIVFLDSRKLPGGVEHRRQGKMKSCRFL